MKQSRSRKSKLNMKRSRSRKSQRRRGGGKDEIEKIRYSDRYSDDKYEYRHVTLPPSIAKLIPKGRLLSEDEWRRFGIQQSRGWVHYELHRPEPNILLFRRPLENTKSSIVRAVEKETDDPFTAPLEAFAEEPLESTQGITGFDSEIIAFLKQKELKYPIKLDYAKQKDITLNMRSILIDWIVDVCLEYRIDIKTLHLCVSLFDRYTCLKVTIVRTKLQMTILAALLIAMKSEEVFPATVDNLVYIADNTFSHKELIKMETKMLEALKYEISYPTCIDFATYYHLVLKLSKQEISLSNYVMDYSLLDVNAYNYRPSLIAAASIYYALRVVKKEWTKKMKEVTEYSEEEVKAVLPAIVQWLANKDKYTAIMVKYLKGINSVVSSLPILNLK